MDGGGGRELGGEGRGISIRLLICAAVGFLSFDKGVAGLKYQTDTSSTAALFF